MAQELTLNSAPMEHADAPAQTRSTEKLGPADAAAQDAEAPSVLDTYALLYALSLVLLVPGALSIASLPFRDYTFAYVSLVTVPFVLGLLATLFTDSRDSAKTLLIRAAVLVPVIILTGVTVLFTSSFIVLPISQVLTPKGFDIAGPIATVSLIVLALPLLPALVRRFTLPLGWRSVAHILALLFAIAVVIGVVALTLRPDRTLATIQRKDVMIYIVGALVWYLPSFGVAAGVWRRVGLV
jgi:hypothetical protein